MRNKLISGWVGGHTYFIVIYRYNSMGYSSRKLFNSMGWGLELKLLYDGGGLKKFNSVGWGGQKLVHSFPRTYLNGIALTYLLTHSK